MVAYKQFKISAPGVGMRRKWQLDCSYLLHMRNLQEQAKKIILLPKIVSTFDCLSKLL